MRRSNRIICLCVCGMCDPALPFTTVPIQRRKSSIKDQPFFLFFFPPFSPALSPFFYRHSSDSLWHISGQLHSGFLHIPPILFTSSPALFRPAFIMPEPNTETTSSHPIFTPLIRFKWHGREGQAGN